MNYVCLEISTTNSSLCDRIKKKIERIYERYEIKVYEVEAAEKYDDSYFGMLTNGKIHIYEVVIGYTQTAVEKRIIKLLNNHANDLINKDEPSKGESCWFDWDLNN